MKDGPVLFYCKDGVIYPVALNPEQHQMLEMTLILLSPLTIVRDKPQGKVVNLLGGSK